MDPVVVNLLASDLDTEVKRTGQAGEKSLGVHIFCELATSPARSKMGATWSQRRDQLLMGPSAGPIWSPAISAARPTGLVMDDAI